jgi:hypothetical protein
MIEWGTIGRASGMGLGNCFKGRQFTAEVIRPIPISPQAIPNLASL